MPELPEVEIVARRIGEAAAGAVVEAARAPGINTLKTVDPPLDALVGRRIAAVGRRGKLPAIDFEGGLTLLVHLMSAGRLQLFDKAAGPRDRTVRLALRLADGRELRLRELARRQSAWARLIASADLKSDEAIARLGPDAWPEPPPFERLLPSDKLLHAALRKQTAIAGIGRAWVDEILFAARLSPLQRVDGLDRAALAKLRRATIETLRRAIEHYERTITLPIPDKIDRPLEIHGRNGEPCPRCGGKIAAIFYSANVLCYCPTCQTGGKIFRDRRLSRLLK